MHSDLAKIIVTENEIQTRVSEMAIKMAQDYSQAENVYLVGILKGAFIFLADLARQHRRVGLPRGRVGPLWSVPNVIRQVYRMAEQVPDSRVFLNNRGTHPLMWSQPQDFRHVSDDFLETLETWSSVEE